MESSEFVLYPEPRRGNPFAGLVIATTKELYCGAHSARTGQSWFTGDSVVAVGFPRSARDRSNAHRSIIRTCIGIADFVFFVGAIRIATQAQAAFAEFKAGIESSG